MSRVPGIRSTGVAARLLNVDRLSGRIEEAREKGEHLWGLFGIWELSQKAIVGYFAREEEVHLDAENLLQVVGPGCYVCEQTWSPEIGARPCPGEPQAWEVAVDHEIPTEGER